MGMIVEMPDHLERACDEIELAIYDLPPQAGINVLVEATARAMARADSVPNNKFLDLLQQRTVEILTEEDDSEVSEENDSEG